MRHGVGLCLSALICITLCQKIVCAQGEMEVQAGRSLATAYSGMIVCEKAPGAADILRVPLDLVIRGDDVQFARPLFNLDGTQVLGSELGAGSADASGKTHLSSTWDFRGTIGHGDYSGTLLPNGGTMTGTQTWNVSEGEVRSRTCQIALVRAANAQRATKP
jgi:hypothetical protein